MVEFNDVSIHFGTQDVLTNASFRINRGERCGLVGPNGAGKSTVFRLITGEISPAAGSVSLEGRLRIGHLHQQVQPAAAGETLLGHALRASPRLEELEAEMRRLETVLAASPDEDTRERSLRLLGTAQTEFENLGGYELETRARAALSGLGFREHDFKRPLSEFSGGWQMRAELVRTLVMQPDLLLMDEPSNYLDLPAVEWMQRYLREYQGTLMLISHDRYLLRSVTNVTLEIDGCTTTRYSGNLDAYLRERRQRHETLLAARNNQDRIREQLQRFIDTFRYTASKAAQVQSRVKQLEKMEEIVVPRQASERGYLRLPEPTHCGTCVMRLQNVGFAYDGTNFVFRNVSFEVGRGDRVALVGYNGMGKTTLMRLLAGMRQPTEGTLVLGHKVVPGYVSQELTEVIPPEQTLLRTLLRTDETLSENSARTLLGSFGFSGDDAFKTSEVLSGGEKIRLAFARLYAARPNVLVLDEPTTHLDLNGRRALEESLQQYDGTVLIVSHDVEFVRAVAAKIIAIDTDGVHTFIGSYDDYREYQSRRATAGEIASGAHLQPEQEAVSETARSSRERRQERAAERARLAPRMNELRRIVSKSEARIMALEAEQAELTAELAEPGTATDFAVLNRRLTDLQAELAAAGSAWEAAATELEELTAEQ